MKPSRLARDLRRISTMAIAATSVLALSATAWGQTPAPPTAPEAAPETAAPESKPEAAAAPTGEAQAEPAAPPQQGPQAIPPPPPSRPHPGYGPPPGVPYPYYYGQPRYAYPIAPRRPLTYRPFMFGVGLGIGALSYSASDMSKHEPALSYSVQLGFSITSRWMALLAMDGSWAQFSFNDQEVKYPGKRSVGVSNFTAGVQFFILRSLYARVGLGVSCLEWSYGYEDHSDCSGQTAAGGLGIEFLQTHSTAVAAELGGFVSRFPEARTIDDRNDIWYHLGVNMILRLF